MSPHQSADVVASGHNHEEPSALLIQFAKWPEVGKVKTRLIPDLGPRGAFEAHLALTRHVLENLLATGFPVELWWDREGDAGTSETAALPVEFEARGLTQRFQSPGDLGDRMVAALDSGLARSSRVIIVGSDCPSADSRYVRKAVEALGEADVVLGPAEDGGYVLIGARRTQPRMLQNVAWGTSMALEQSRMQLERMQMTTRLLDERWDVDEFEDWQRFCRHSSP